MNIGAPELLILLIPLVAFVLPAWGIVDAAIRPDNVWSAAQQNKLVWVVVQIVVPVIGTIVYFAVVRPKLTAVRG